VAATAKEIVAAGGTAEAAQVDALDESAVEEHIAAVVKTAGTVDISFNALKIELWARRDVLSTLCPLNVRSCVAGACTYPQQIPP